MEQDWPLGPGLLTSSLLVAEKNKSLLSSAPGVRRHPDVCKTETDLTHANNTVYVSLFIYSVCLQALWKAPKS